MIFHKLTLNNVGLFRGQQTIRLTPNGKGPIILVGGKNGRLKLNLAAFTTRQSLSSYRQKV